MKLVAALFLASALAVPGGRPVQGVDRRDAGLASFDDVWQTVADTFYDPTFGGLDWPAVRRELRPKAEAAASPDELRAVIREMLARLKRSHFELLSASEADEAAPVGDATVPVAVRVTADGVVIISVANGLPADRPVSRPATCCAGSTARPRWAGGRKARTRRRAAVRSRSGGASIARSTVRRGPRRCSRSRRRTARRARSASHASRSLAAS